MVHNFGNRDGSRRFCECDGREKFSTFQRTSSVLLFFVHRRRNDASGSSYLRFRHNRAASNISRLVIAHVRSAPVTRIRRVIACAPMSTMHTRNSRALYSADVPRINFAAVGANMNISEISTRARPRNSRGNPTGMRKLPQFSGWHGKLFPERGALSSRRNSECAARELFSPVTC